jgi:hypothetical protein
MDETGARGVTELAFGAGAEDVVLGVVAVEFVDSAGGSAAE